MRPIGLQAVLFQEANRARRPLRVVGGQFLTDVIPYRDGLVAAGTYGSAAGFTGAVWTSP